MISREAQTANIGRFIKKLPINARATIRFKTLPNGGIAVQARSKGRVPGSCAIYEKQIDASGQTVQYTKTTMISASRIAHVKDKLKGETFPC